MPDFVKKFISDNIDYIEAHDWETVWKNWSFIGNDYYVEEFIGVLKDIDIDIEQESERIRLDMITKRVEELLDKLILTRHRITYRDLLLGLKSQLAIPEDTLYELFDVVAKNQGYHKATNGFYRF